MLVFVEKPVFIIMKFIIGKKLDMTQVWQGEKQVGVTKVQAGPCVVAQVKTKDKDGYEAVQIGFGERKEKNIKKPQLGHLAKLGASAQGAVPASGRGQAAGRNLRYLREFKCSGASELNIGDVIDVSTFDSGDNIQVTGVSKGKGFQGVVKRHGFHGQDKTHGTKDQLRMSGSVGSTGPAHVFKGVRMPGRMGGEQVTTKNLEVIEVDKENNILLIKGAVPGARNGLVLIQGEGDLVVKQMDADEKEKQIATDDQTAGNSKQTAENADAAAEDTKEAAENKIEEENKKASE